MGEAVGADHGHGLYLSPAVHYFFRSHAFGTRTRLCFIPSPPGSRVGFIPANSCVGPPLFANSECCCLTIFPFGTHAHAYQRRCEHLLRARRILVSVFCVSWFLLLVRLLRSQTDPMLKGSFSSLRCLKLLHCCTRFVFFLRSACKHIPLAQNRDPSERPHLERSTRSLGDRDFSNWGYLTL